MKNLVRIFSVMLISLMFCSCVFATETSVKPETVSKDKTVMSLVKDEECNIDFGTYGHFQKKLSNIDLQNKTIDIDLKAINSDPGGHKKTITVEDDVAGEVVLLIDISYSMEDNTYKGVTRKQMVLDAASSLVDKLYTAKSDINIGLVKFSTDKHR